MPMLAHMLIQIVVVAAVMAALPIAGAVVIAIVSRLRRPMCRSAGADRARSYHLVGTKAASL